MNLTNAQIKLLSEFLGENISSLYLRRSFTSPQDMMDLKDKLMEKKMWDDFGEYLWKNTEFVNRDESGFCVLEWSSDLFSPATFIPLVAEFMEDTK